MYEQYHRYLSGVKRLYHKYLDREWIYISVLTLMSLFWNVRFYFRVKHSSHPLAPSEDSQWYLDYAHGLLAHFKIGLNMDELLYMGYNVLLALLLAVFKQTTIIIFIQSVTTALGVILVYKIARMLFNRLTAIIAGYFYYNAWNVSIWSMYILSDSFFISLLLLNVFWLLKAMASGKKVYKILFIASSLYMIVFRPTGVISLVFILIYIGLNLDRKKVWAFVKRYRIPIGGTAAAVVAAGSILLLTGKLEPFFTSLEFNAKKVLYNIYAKGWIYDKPSPLDYVYKPDYSINVGDSLILSFLFNNWNHILVLYARRVVAFLGWWVWDTHLTGKAGLKKFAHDIMPTFLFIAGTFGAIVSKRFRKVSIVWLVFLAVFVFCIIFFIDGLYRYKAPALPFIYIVCAYGVDRIIRLIVYVAKKYSGMLLWKKEKPSL